MINIDEIQKVTPFISPIRLSGGTFYVFNSASEDLTFSFNQNTNRKFKFSKFALLNIPEIVNSKVKNTIKLDAIPGAYNSVRLDNISNYNKLFAESFQNYCLNLETALLSKSSYNSELTKTVSERVFFKWLKELGAIRFNKANIDQNDEYPRYTEEITSNKYERVVKYIGEIDYINNYFGQENTYSEVYVHIPQEVGDFNDVYFKSIEDDNYKSGMTIGRIENTINSEVLMGRSYDDVHPYGLNINAYYDNPNGLNAIGEENLTQLKLYKKIVGRTDNNNSIDDYILNDWWYPQTSMKNNYYTEIDSFSDDNNDDLALYKETGATSNISFETGATFVKRSRLDGISLDFNIDSYNKANGNVFSLIDVARSNLSKDFEFNCILVYYDIYENKNTSVIVDYDENNNPIYEKSNSDFNILDTNLFGVLFLDNVETGTSLGGGKIPTYKKCRPNQAMNLNGNAYGFKINLKLDVSPNDTTVKVETVISNSNTLSMDIFANALNEFKRISETISTSSLDVIELDSRMRKIENNSNMFDNQNIYSLTNRLKSIETILAEDNLNTSSVIKDKQDVLDLLNKNYEILYDIINGKISSNIQLNTDIFKQGSGIKLDKINNKIVINSTEQNYSYSDKIVTSIVDDWKSEGNFFTYKHKLKHGKNYLRISDSNFYTRKHIKLLIDDSENNWEIGQIFKIYFEYPIYLNNAFGDYNFSIFTDSNNILNNPMEYSANIFICDSTMLANKKSSFAFEIHCIDNNKLKFIVDLI